jgi:hypothetical protein
VIPTLDFSCARYQVQLRELIASSQADDRDFLTQQMLLLLRKIISFTPPHSLAEGRIATRRDVYRAVKPFEVDSFRDPRLKQIVEDCDYAAFGAFMQYVKNPALQGAEARPWSESLHQDQRDRRGRVLRSRKVFVIGRPAVSAFKKYLTRKLDNVGIAAAGWLAALHLLGGFETSWIERHGTRYGSVIDQRSDPANPSVTAINSTPWASRKEEGERIIRYAMASRANAMIIYRGKLLEISARKAGLKAA